MTWEELEELFLSVYPPMYIKRLRFVSKHFKEDLEHSIVELIADHMIYYKSGGGNN